MWGTAVAGAFVVLVIVNFAWFWPIYVGDLITTPQWLRPDLVPPLDLSGVTEHVKARYSRSGCGHPPGGDPGDALAGGRDAQPRPPS